MEASIMEAPPVTWEQISENEWWYGDWRVKRTGSDLWAVWLWRKLVSTGFSDPDTAKRHAERLIQTQK